MSYHRDIFDGFELTPSESEFVKNVTNMQGSSMAYGEVHAVLSNFYLAKQIEKSSLSTDQSSKAMERITWLIAIFTSIQAIGVLIGLISNNYFKAALLCGLVVGVLLFVWKRRKKNGG